MDFRRSLLVLKKEDLLQEVKNRKHEKKYAAPASQAREVYGKARYHQSNGLLLREKEREVRAKVEIIN